MTTLSALRAHLLHTGLHLSPAGIPGTPLIVVDLDELAANEPATISHTSALLRESLPLTIGILRGPLTPDLEPLAAALTMTLTSAQEHLHRQFLVPVPDLDAALEQLTTAITFAPQSSLACGQLLRRTSGASTTSALAAEAAVYSMLLGGTEFARWLGKRDRPRRREIRNPHKPSNASGRPPDRRPRPDTSVPPDTTSTDPYDAVAVGRTEAERGRSVVESSEGRGATIQVPHDAIAADRAEADRGRSVAESPEDRGDTVQVPHDAVAADRAEADRGRSAIESPGGRGGTIQVADDTVAVDRTEAGRGRGAIGSSGDRDFCGDTVQVPHDAVTVGRTEADRGRSVVESSEDQGGCGDAVQVRRAGSALTVVLNQPGRRNALGAGMREELLAALTVAEADPGIESVELGGSGPAFCSGGDLAEFGAATDPVAAYLVRLERAPWRVLDRIAGRVTVRVHGACVGAGAEIAAFGGRVVAAPDTWFRFPEIAMGLIPGAGGTVSVPRRIGRWRAAWLMLSGTPLAAREALRWGLVDEITESSGEADAFRRS
ncbi:enoyl-CoA hydratase/isomerase family protein [Nocardia sp. NPDC048505]|uniref:enoyl-CoA hydratase/isomerase family protein n=1 Tax=unclassified Nocardia TaxID=2637762 RepID=UPI003401C34A